MSRAGGGVPKVSFSSVTKRYAVAGTPAVAGLSFEAPAGAITALLGPSGAGKSTALRLVAGLEEPDAGRIEIGDEDVTRTPPQRRGVGVVFQGYALFRHLTVRRNVAFGLEVRGVPRREVDRRVDELLALVELLDLGDRRPDELSGGQQQRVAFARALAPHPRVLLLDEPFAALDVRVRRDLREWLAALHRGTGVTTLLVTHDQDEAFELAQRVVMLFDGRAVQAGSPAELWDRPATARVAAFLGGSNVLSGRVENGRAHVGALEIAAPTRLGNGASVRAVVRPRDVKLAKLAGRANGHAAAATGRVERLVRVGGQVRLSLVLRSGQSVSVEAPLAEAEALGAAVGTELHLDLAAAKVFPEDWSI